MHLHPTNLSAWWHTSLRLPPSHHQSRGLLVWDIQLMNVFSVLHALPCFAHHALQRETSGSLWSPPRLWPCLTTVCCCRVEFRGPVKKTKHADENHEVELKPIKKDGDVCSFRVCLTLGRQSVAKGSNRNYFSGSNQALSTSGCTSIPNRGLHILLCLQDVLTLKKRQVQWTGLTGSTTSGILHEIKIALVKQLVGESLSKMWHIFIHV